MTRQFLTFLAISILFVSKASFAAQADRPSGYRKPALFLDLDQMLVVSVWNGNTHVLNPDHLQQLEKTVFSTPSNLHHGSTSIVTHLRPGARQFISDLSPHFYIFVFTSSAESYAHQVWNFLDENDSLGVVREGRFFTREHCTLTPISEIYSQPTKNLRTAASQFDIDWDRALLLDDAIYNHRHNIQNAIWVPAFNGDPNDNYLSLAKELLLDWVIDCESEDKQKECFNYLRAELHALHPVTKEHARDFDQLYHNYLNIYLQAELARIAARQLK